MEILCLTHKYPPSVGGMEKQSHELVQGLSRFSRVHLLACGPEEKKVFFFLKLRRRVKRMLRDFPGIQLIHCNDAVMAAFSIWLKKYTNVPVVATFHGLDVVFPNKLYQKFIFPRFKKLDKIIGVSRFTAEACVSRGIPAEKITVIHNGIDHDLQIPLESEPTNPIIRQLIHSQSSAGKKVLISVGRAVRRKGFMWFVREVLPGLPEDYIFAVAGPLDNKTLSSIPDWILPRKVKKQYNLFWGKATDSDDIREIQQSSSIPNFVHLGKISDNDLRDLYALADLFVMPNIQVPGDAEGFGLVALEACMHGTVVLASELEGIKDAITHGRNGWLVTPSDAAAWSSAIQYLCTQDEEREKLQQNAKNFTMAHFSWDKMGAEYDRLFRKICEIDELSTVSSSEKKSSTIL